MEAAVQARYASALMALTSSDRAVIKYLSELARENMPFGGLVVGAIAERVYNIQGNPVPTLHLIDSICKNVGLAYIPLFGAVIPQVFGHIYSICHPEDKQRALRVRGTWDVVFPPEVLGAVDAVIYEIDSMQQHLAPMAAPIAPFPVQHAMPVDMSFVAPPPFQPAPVQHIPMAAQPPMFTPAPMQIQLPPMRPAELWDMNIPMLEDLKQQTIEFYYQLDDELKAGPSRERHMELVDFQEFLKNELNRIDAEVARKHRLPPVQPVVEPPPVQQPHIPLVPPGPSSVPGGAPRPSPLGTNGGLQPLPVVVPPVARPKMTFAKEDLSRREDYFVRRLYEGRAMRCNTCGVRFAEGEQALQQKHYDWHFRLNKARKDPQRNRGWLLPHTDWVKFTVNEYLDETGAGDENSDDASEIAETLTVVVDEKNTCGICGEQFETEFKQDLDEWHFKGALRNAAGTFHVLCYRDAEESGTLPSPIALRSQRSSISEAALSEDIPRMRRDTADESGDGNTAPVKKFRS